MPQTLRRHLSGTTPDEETSYSDKMMSNYSPGLTDYVNQCLTDHSTLVAMPYSFMALCLMTVVAGAACAQDRPDRIGFQEDFSSAKGWGMEGVRLEYIGPASIVSDGEQATFTTKNGTLSGLTGVNMPKWPDWDPNAPTGGGGVSKQYPNRVDLDRYHYLVARMTHSGTNPSLRINGIATSILYTTGTHAVDLRNYNDPRLRGMQPIDIQLGFLNTEAKFVLDYVRLVDDLTLEEEAGLIPRGLDLRLETLDPRPYHGLEAMNARAGSPVRFDMPNEGLVFEDTSTGAQIWRLTGTVRTENWISLERFNGDGSAIPFNGRMNNATVIYDFDERLPRELPGVRGQAVWSRDDTSLMYVLERSEAAGVSHFAIRSHSIRTGKTSTVTEWTSTDSDFKEVTLWRSGVSDMLLVELTEGRVFFVINPHEPDVEKRVRRVDVPMRVKGTSFSNDDQQINFNRALYFQKWQFDLATDELRRANTVTLGHGVQDNDILLVHYQDLMIASRRGLLPLDESDADQVRIWANWKKMVPSDYCVITPDNRWVLTNGTGDPVMRKLLLIDGNETGTVMQVAHAFISRSNWDVSTYSKVSPDATKVGFNSDMFGDADICLAISRRPHAPRSLTAIERNGDVLLQWDAPPETAETRGYNVYRSEASGRDYRRINPELVTDAQFVDTNPLPTACYAVVAEEHSGLEGLYSQEAIIGQPASYRVQAELEESKLTPPIRQYFDGSCGNFRSVRVWKEAPEETVGQAEVELTMPASAQYTAWLRVRGAGKVGLRAGDSSGALSVDSPGWSWAKIEPGLKLREGRQVLTLSSDSDGLSLDRLLLTSDPANIPSGIDERDPKPSPVQELQVTKAAFNEVRLRWAECTDPDFDHYSLHVGNREDFTPSNATLLASGRRPEGLDWGFKPGSTLFYTVVAVNKRGIASAPATAVRVDAPALNAATIELAIADAQLSGGLVLGESRGVSGAYLPERLPRESPRPKATWQFAVPQGGTYYVWARYTTYDAKNASLFYFETDAGPVDGNWRLRMPQTLDRHRQGTIPGEETWFADKMMSNYWPGLTDFVTFEPGAHRLSVGFETNHAPNGPRLAAVYLSNDPSYRPPGYDPRIDFVK